MAQLRLETGEFEVASEAALHRISQSSAAAPSALATPGRRNNMSSASAMPSPFASLPRGAGNSFAADSSATGGRPTSSAGGKPAYFSQVKNRFPESVADEEEEDIDSSGSEPDYASAAEAGFDPASASDTGGNAMPGEDEDVSSNAGGDMGIGENGHLNRSAWTLRDPAIYKPLTPGGSGRPAGEMDVSSLWTCSMQTTPRLNELHGLSCRLLLFSAGRLQLGQESGNSTTTIVSSRTMQHSSVVPSRQPQPPLYPYPRSSPRGSFMDPLFHPHRQPLRHWAQPLRFRQECKVKVCRLPVPFRRVLWSIMSEHGSIRTRVEAIHLPQMASEKL